MTSDEELHNGHQDTCPMGLLLNPEDLHDKRTLCRHCQQLGPDATTSPVGGGVPLDERPPDPPARSSFLWEAETVTLLQQQLGLEEWTVRLAEGFDGLDEEAYVRIEPRERVATIFVHPASREYRNGEVFERLICHELIHVLLYDLQSLAMNDRPIPVMDLVDLELERVINRLTTAITGHRWEPIDPRVRELHEFEDEEDPA